MFFPMRMNTLLLAGGSILLLMLGSLSLSGCRAGLSTVTVTVASGLPAAVTVPSGLRRFAIAHPSQAPDNLLPAYAVLETESRRLTAIRPSRLVWSLASRENPLVWQAERENLTSLEKMEESNGLMDADALLFFQIDAPHLTSSMGASFSGHLPPVTVTTSIARIGTEEEFFHDVVSVTVRDAVVHATEQELTGLYSHLLQFAIRQTLSDLSQAFSLSTDGVIASLARDQ